MTNNMTDKYETMWQMLKIVLESEPTERNTNQEILALMDDIEIDNLK